MKSAILLGTAAAALLLSPLGTANAQITWPQTGSQSAMGALSVDPKRGVLTLAPLLERAMPAVVSVTTTSKIENPRMGRGQMNSDFLQRFFGDEDQFEEFRRRLPELERGESEEFYRQGAGSGVVIDAGKGYVLSNHHVVDGAETITLKFHDGRTAEAELVGSDNGTDIALLKVDLKGLTALRLADSDTVKVGDYAIAIGNSFGIGQTVSTGIVSALGRSTGSGDKYQDFIQTDAAINRGNSGGALINSKGELIGVNAAILSRSGGSNGVGFAVPTNMVTGIMDQLVAYGEVRRGRIGVQIQNITPEIMEAMELKSLKGALVAQVMPKSPAEKAGISVGDVIVGFNGREILDSDDIRNAVGYVERGRSAKISYLRDGKKFATRIRVEEAPKEDESASIANDNQNPKAAPDQYKAFSGATFENLDTNSELEGGRQGVKVVSIKRSSDAWDAGLRKGDIVRAVNTRKIKNLADFKSAVEGRSRAVALTVQRGRNQIFIAVR